MKRIFLAIALVLVVFSCGQRKKGGSATETPKQLTLEELPYLNFTDSLSEYRLCDQELTSFVGLLEAFYNDDSDFLRESTSVDETFYFPAEDIARNELATQVQSLYNYASVLNRVIHAYDWFTRMSTDETEKVSKAKKRRWAKQSSPKISPSTLDRALRDQEKIVTAEELLDAYAAFDGDDSEGSPFYNAVIQYREVGEKDPDIVDIDKADDFKNIFWSWYDKNEVVPGIDEVTKVNLKEYKGDKLSKEQLNSLKYSIAAEKDIDRRTIMALEYVKFDRIDGVILLGEILESGIYTKYLFEAWISWRAHAQMEHSPSSFSVIPNNYFDRVRVKCIDTYVRHCIQEKDPNAEWMLANLMYAEIVHRMASLAGNESFKTVVDLAYGMFVHPRLLKEDEAS